jgi:SAM-dependent methyltransferase
MQSDERRHDAALPPAERRARGAYYTPESVVRWIVDATLTDSFWARFDCPAVLDPACGDGAFLVGVAERMAARLSDRSPGKVAGALQRTLFGIDLDAAAIELARKNVARAALGRRATSVSVESLERKLRRNIVVGDALAESLPREWPNAFSAIVGNPPYVNIRRLAAQNPAAVEAYRNRFITARRGFDLYVLFIERAIELLAEGGRCGLIVPNKLATLDYAANCRELLIERTQIESIADCSRAPVFADASVYPHVIVFERGRASPDHQVRVVQTSDLRSDEPFQPQSATTVLQSRLNDRGVFAWSNAFDLEHRLPTRRLDEMCRLFSGTTGFLAQRIAGELVERGEESGDAFPFITSGNIDRYRLRLGDVRYMKRRFRDPLLPAESSLLSAEKRRLFGAAKIVIAGMSRRLEAAWHAGPLALGVQVFAAADFQLDPHLVLAILNSRLMSRWFHTRYSAKRLGGGFFSVHKGQLAALPMPDPARLNLASIKLCKQIARLARQASQSMSDAIDRRIDLLVESLYVVTNDEERRMLETPEGGTRRAA